jgi:hypothetical protein
MKTLALIAFLILVVVGTYTPAQGQPCAKGSDQINIYSDPAFTSKEAFDLAPGMLTLYAVHEHASDRLTAAFMIAPSVGFTGVWLGETSPFSTIGMSPTGIRIAYGQCLDTPALILEVTYTVFGTSDDCSYLEVVEHPEEVCGGPVFLDCPNFDTWFGTGGRLTVNPNETCTPIPIEPSTWGKVKALYR